MRWLLLTRNRPTISIAGAALVAFGVCSAASEVHAGTPSAADIKLTQVIDRATIKGELIALEDATSHTLVLIYRALDETPRVFVGTAGLLFEQEIPFSTWGSTPDMDLSMLAPRARPYARTTLKAVDGKFSYNCSDKDIATLTPVPPAALAKALANATFRSSALVRGTVMLARDAAGIYYFVDRLVADNSDFRVFVGKRGKLKQLRLVDIADDEAGMVFETKTGDLRLTIDNNQARTVTWNVKSKAKALKWLDPESAQYLIKRELGIYGSFGTLCDDR